MRIWILTIIVWIMLVASSGADGGFTQVDRERMIRLEVKFEEIDKRFEQMDKRFEQVDKRLVELREDMNNRFEQVDKRFVELREDMNNRFVQVDKRFEQIMSMFYILSGIFTAMFTAVFGFAWWDRRTILVQAREEARNILKPHENRSQGVEEKLNNIAELLRRWSAKKPELKELMRYCNLL
jgi:exonuclease VII large subunit